MRHHGRLFARIRQQPHLARLKRLGADGSAPRQQKFNEPPEMGIDPSKRYTATMETSMGTIVIALFLPIVRIVQLLG